MYSSNEIIEILNNNMKNTEKFFVSKLALFGSFARNQETDNSDVYILVRFEDGHETFDNYMNLKFYLEELFDRKVDLVIIDSIKPSIKPGIMISVIYAKGA
ncbi:hypothetical protein SAMN02745975_02414 [Geosporobacter subterraneus DSM 17957]|uniref:Polymerase nucleotidyl transferase domain-containing protein n=1 Tax=Geosporobacter subterraneus DSM 17957 TaxID=1121919 RepID=A0A1M6KJ38_9FIRM|nr:nucleotidyltransferase family protein [Geosporobacter subterraneus]SHJ58998.1 hypothetical protein SAMN02745975_02414 [Geosporobacter subterraneus DSM 17957]